MRFPFFEGLAGCHSLPQALAAGQRGGVDTVVVLLHGR